MRRQIHIFFLFFVVWIGSLFGTPAALKMEEIPLVLERFFALHIETKEFTPALVRRSMKLYLEQFDPEKSYLLESEILPYLNLSDKACQKICARLKKGDYSDFVALNGVIQRAVIRAQKLRNSLAPSLVEKGGEEEVVSGRPAQYPTSEKEIVERQKWRLDRFFSFHKQRTHLESSERRALVCALFEKKARKGEYLYLFLNPDGTALSQEKVENAMAVRILKALAKGLDTHTAFFSPEEAYEMRMSLEKRFEGVGVVLSEGIDGVMIAELIPGSPAHQSGRIQANDLLVEVDGESVEERSFEEVLDLLKRRDQNVIVLGIKRVDPVTFQGMSFQVPLKKEPIVMHQERIQTSFEKFGDKVIGKIALYSFYETSDGLSCERDIKEAIRSFRERGELIGLILDLRENSGGFLGQAVKVAGLFLSNGVIVISKYGMGELHYLRNIVSKSYFNGPLVILTSKMSASASEIVAQALQDYGVAVVVGDERTFGKGSIQYQTVTDEAAELFFKVTVGRYYTVSGKSTQIDGVLADIVVPTQYAPYNIGERFLEYPLSPDRVSPAYLDPLTDLDERTRRIFQVRYLPYLQRVIPFWKKMIPSLRKNSAYRLSHDPNFQIFLQKQEEIRSRQGGLSVNTIDEPIQIGMEDLQMTEGVNVVKDMLLMEAEWRKEVMEADSLPATGSE